MDIKMNNELIYTQINRNTIYYYNDIDIYSLVNGKYVLYKPAGYCIPKSKILIGNIPTQLFIKNTENNLANPEIQRKFKYELDNLVLAKNVVGIKNILIKSVMACSKENSFSLNGFKVVLNTLIEKFYDNVDFFISISKVTSHKGDIVAIRSVDCAMLLLAYCIENKISNNEWLDYAITGLIHDIGELRLPLKYISEKDIINNQYERYIKHTFDGFNILVKEYGLNVSDRIAIATLKHHELKNGSGYPNKESIVDPFVELITIVDVYTKILSENSCINTVNALSRMKGMVKRGELNRELFEKFIFTLI